MANNRHIPTLLIAIFLVSPCVEHTVMAQDKPQPLTSIGPTTESGSDRLIVKYRFNSAAQVSGQLNRLSKSEVIKRLPFINADVVRIPEGSSLEEIIAWYEESPDVEYAEPDYRVFPIGGLAAATTPDDPQYINQYHLNNTGQTEGTADADVDAPEAWDITTGDSTIVVAVIDTGIDTEHPDLLGNMWVNEGEIAGDLIDNDGNGFVDDIHGWDFANDDNSVYDGADNDYHGTHVAGTIGAVSNNGIGVAGVAWNVRIMSLKFLHGGGFTSDAIDALAYAKANGAKFTSNSWGGGGHSVALDDAITAHGGLFIAAAGNESSNSDLRPAYPAASDNDLIISVASTDNNDGLSGFSNYGERTVDLGAPGSAILATWPENEYKAISGTSMATPVVSGTAVLVYARFPDLSPSQMKDRLMYSGDVITSLAGKTVSGRRVNALNSLEDDQVKPSAVTDLIVTADATPIINPMAARHLLLEWTSSGDDGTSGRAARYDLRYSTEPITEATFSAALRITSVPLPQLPGRTENTVAAGLNPLTDYYFAIQVLDNVGNASGLSNEATGKTLSARRLFADDAETTASDTLWSADSPWARTADEGPPQGSYNWTDSPGDYYANNLDISLTSVTFSLTDATRSTIKFDHKYEIENGYDFGYVEASYTGGAYWDRLATFGGTQDWTGETLDLSSYDGKPEVMIRFRLVTDDLWGFDGWSVDDIQVSADNVGLLTTDVSVNESGDTLVVGIGLANEGFGVAGASYQMHWPDPANLVTYVGVTETERISGLTHSINLDEANNSVTGILIDTGLEETVASGTGALVEYRFALKSDLNNAEAAVVAEAHPDGIRAGLPRVFYEVAFDLQALSLSSLDGNPVSAGGRGGRWEKEILIGDVDFSSAVDVTDVVSTIDYVLGKVGFNRVQRLVADTFLDKIINVVDVVRTINIILGRCIGDSECGGASSMASAPALTASRQAGNEVPDRDLDILLQPNAGLNSIRDRTTLNVVADIPPDVVGLQLGVEYDPSRIRVSGARLLLEGDGFELAQNIGPSKATFMIYSPTSASLPADTQSVIALEFESETDGFEPSAIDFQLTEVLGVDAVGMPVYPGINPMLAVKDLLGTPNLDSSQKAQLDRRGNRDGVFNLGDLLALLRRSGLLDDGAGLSAWRAPRQETDR
jgi:subtilisin family serine protease